MRLNLAIPILLALTWASQGPSKLDEQKKLDDHKEFTTLPDSTCTDPGPCYDGYQSSFSFDLGSRDRSSWMTGLSNHTLISNMSIAGTHNSMNIGHRRYELYNQNQNIPIQLKGGIRYFEIGVTAVNNKFRIAHGNKDLNTTLLDVLNSFVSFLKANPQEALVVRLKEEELPGKKTKLEDALQMDRFDGTREINDIWRKYMWSPRKPRSDEDDTSAFWPAIGDLRGKILVLQDFGVQEKQAYGTSWRNQHVYPQDNCAVINHKDLIRKCETVYQNMRNAIQGADRIPSVRFVQNAEIITGELAQQLSINHWSADSGLPGIEVAAGSVSRNGPVSQGINQAGTFWLQKFNDTRRYRDLQRVGINVMDFPGQKPVDQIIGMNNYN